MQDLSQRDLIAYIIYTSDKIKEFNDKTIDNYLNLLFETIKNVHIGQVLFEIDLRVFNNFSFNAILNKEEIINYSALIYKLLLNHFDRRFDKEDIIKDSIIIFTKESVRTAKEKVAEEKIINATEYYIKY